MDSPTNFSLSCSRLFGDGWPLRAHARGGPSSDAEAALADEYDGAQEGGVIFALNGVLWYHITTDGLRLNGQKYEAKT